MTDRWKYTGYTINGHRILRLHEIRRQFPYGSPADSKAVPLDRYKCEHCDRRAEPRHKFAELPECELTPDPWFRKIVRLFRKT